VVLAQGPPKGLDRLFHLLLLLSFLGGFGDLASLSIGLLHALDDTNSNGLPHVPDSESTKGRVLLVRLDTHGLGGNELDDGGVTRLQELGGGLHDLTGSSVDLLDELTELASNVGGVAVEDGCVSGTDLTGVVQDDDLGVERSGLLGGVVLGVGTDVSSPDVLDGNVLDVESDVVTGVTLGNLLVVHLDRLDFGGDVGRSKVDDHTGLDDTGLDSTDGNCSDTTNLVDVLERESEGLVGRSDRGLNGVDGLQKGLTLGDTGLGLLGPTLVPGHVGRVLQHVVSVPSGDGDEGNRLGVVTDLLDESGSLLNDFLVSVLGPLAGVHLVDGDDELPDSQSESQKSVLSGLTILGDTSLEFTDTRGDDQDGTIGLGSSSDHVLDKVSVTGGVDDGDVVSGSLELPESNVDGDTTLTLGLKFVKNPSILERGLSELGSLLLELLDGSLVNSTTLVDQVSGGGGLSRVDVSDDNDVNVNLIFTHFCVVLL